VLGGHVSSVFIDRAYDSQSLDTPLGLIQGQFYGSDSKCYYTYLLSLSIYYFVSFWCLLVCNPLDI
jgi:hypothetical protein